MCVLGILLSAALLLWTQEDAEIEKRVISGFDMERADLYHLKDSQQVEAVLVLCPGCNGNGESLLLDPDWRKFSRMHKLGLVGLSFASNDALFTENRGYYYASKGSGEILLEGIRKIYGKDMPLLLYGFSGGAHFTSRFEEWRPDRVICWCAYSAGWWDLPRPSKFDPPGIIACGDDDPRYGASLIYFTQGRALGKPWLWLPIPRVGHSVSPPIEEFIRNYFEAILAISHLKGTPPSSGVWLDVGFGNLVNEASEPPSLTGWLPEESLLSGWKKISIPSN